MFAGDLIQLLVRGKGVLLACSFGLPLVVTAIMFLAPVQYEAVSRIVVSAGSGGVYSLAVSAAEELHSSGLSISPVLDKAGKAVVVTVKGDDSEACSDAANKVIDATSAQTEMVYPDVRISVHHAENTTDNRPSWAKIIAAAFVFGIFLAVCYLLFRDALVRPIRSASHFSAQRKCPLLGTFSNDFIDNDTVANILHTSHAGFGARICVVPVGADQVSRIFCNRLVKTLEAEGVGASVVDIHTASDVAYAAKASYPGLVLYCCDGLGSGAPRLLAARSAGLVIVVAQQWVDTIDKLEKTLHGLSVAQTTVAGCVLFSKSRRK